MRKLFQPVFEWAFSALLAMSVMIWILPVPEAFASPAPNQCESWHRPDGYDEAWIPASFKPFCATHSHCYQTADTTWSTCNAEFYASLRKSCEAMYPHAVLSAGSSKSSDDDASGEASLITCLQVADEFYSKVQSPPALKQYQAMQEKSVHQVSAL